ncbi:putative Kila-N domain-containing protein [Acanthamoeba castellanii mimivirus]|uniref:Putative KilA-N domain-containing protein L33 n=5 Tax=Mimivirus TaxID=315393 RepID=YL033_MIMIV|nr:putative Kila-N domain-containing protein [Acanthamoeba polyphaga mimivirus]Q5UPA4.1 RecName: Full=Putative KilA-N domain-containing protein L33 [Acanthamoeba polyphaga mimivirus]AHA45858.1 putative KilA-N domain-containing protein [Hirudovirus strain Sangsue]AMK61718.1 putative Kila-N domain-containing protein [Samba virus]AMZ02484.1 putative Kila-N domain-containing protein [Mimivirus Bombay]BAV61105.1 putative Kila-N domain-containing protein [Acanthamoeba castellanii mimivirus]AAV50308
MSKKISRSIDTIIFVDINSRYTKCQYCDIYIIIDNENGYINITSLCSIISKKIGKEKTFKQWKKNKTSKEQVEEMAKLEKISEKKLFIDICSGPKKMQGKYIHPGLVTLVVHWISPEFAAKVSLWIEEWRRYSSNNSDKYYESLLTANPSYNSQREKEIQEKLLGKYGGEIEVETKTGRIDLMTNDKIIEIKNYYKWKNAIGQLFAYSIYYPDKKKCLYLFNVGTNDLNEIKKVCKKYDVKLKVYD